MFVVAVLTEAEPDSYPSLESVKDRIKSKVYNELKGEYLAEKMKQYNGDFNKIKENLNVMEKDVNPLFYNARNLPGFTIENEVIGTVFGMENGQTSEPIIGTSAVFVVKVNDITKAGDVTNYGPVINTLTDNFKKSVDQDKPYMALKESLEIIDNRIEFY